MRSKVYSDWLPGYIKATRPVLEIFQMARYFPDRPHMYKLGYYRIDRRGDKRNKNFKE